MTGTWVLLAALVLSVLAGLLHRRRDGQLRPARGRSLQVPIAVADNAAGAGDPGTTDRDSIDLSSPRSGGTDQGAPGAAPDGAAGAPDLRPLLVGLGLAPGERATLVQFSSAFCAPCRATRRILGEVSALVPGVVHLEIDAESQLALVRRLGIRKTPTTLVLDAGGREVKRATGAPRKADVIAAVGSALPLPS